MSSKIQQTISRAVGGSVAIASIRDPADGTVKFTVTYSSRATYWQSRHRFTEVEHAQAGALALSDFLGAEVHL
ncbi:hypothetical protein [Bradyrhizobium sp. USDA 3364]